MFGQTLVDALVVLGVCAIAGAALLPAAVLARRMAEERICLNNLRQLHWGVMRYADDHNDELMSHFTNGKRREYWFNLLPPYLDRKRFYPMKNGIMCPSNPTKRLVASGWVNYAMNSDVGRSHRGTLKKRAQVRMPAEAVLFSDGSPKGPGSKETWYVTRVPTKNAILPGIRGGLSEGALRHRGGLNVVFLDGHARYVSRKELDSSSTRLWEMDD